MGLRAIQIGRIEIPITCWEQIRLAVLITVVYLLAGCGSDSMGEVLSNYDYEPTYPGSTIGATPGGAQDIGLARATIAAGGVPSADSFLVEGLLSEHDLSLEGPECDSLLCARPALGVAPSLETGEIEYWVQLGMSSGIKMADFERPPLDVVLLIDRSASMNIDMVQTTQAAARFVEQMNPRDRLAVLAFNNSVETLHSAGPVEDAQALIDEIRGLRASGGSNLMSGMQAAYRVAHGMGHDPNRLRRVVVLSCGYPDAGSTSAGSFSDLVAGGGQSGIGLTFIGVLLGFDHALANTLSQERGGSYIYLTDLDRVTEVFDEDFDFMMTPLGYDLNFRFDVGNGFELARLYGIPGDDNGDPRTEFQVTTVFASRGGGAIVARLGRIGDSNGLSAIAKMNLAYAPEPAVGWSDPENQEVDIMFDSAVLEGDAAHYEQNAVRKTVALVNQAEELRRACDAYHTGEVVEAIAIAERLHTYLAGEAEVLGDPDLDTEVALVARLIENMR